MANSERQQMAQFIQNAPGNGAVDQSALAKQFSLLTQSATTRAKEYEVFNKMNAAQQRERHQGFLKFLIQVMGSRNLVLPPFITGSNNPPYDPNNSSFGWLEPGSYTGAIKVLDKDVDVYKFWHLVFNAGTSVKITSENAWTKVVQAFELPQQLPEPHPATASISTADLLQKIFLSVLGPLEQVYVQKVRQQRGQQQPGMSNAPDSSLQVGSPLGTHLLQPPTPAASSQTYDGADMSAPDGGEDKKRRMDEDEERDAKKMKMDPSLEPTLMSTSPERDPNSQSPQRASTIDGDVKPGSTPQPPRTIPTRNKIEYVPLKRELDTYGGRDLDAIEEESKAIAARRPHRAIDEWGTIDVDGLSLAIRSRVSTELSYALTTMTYLSSMRSNQPNRGFPLPNSGELLEDLLDLLEETAFGPGYDGLNIGLGEKVVMPRFPATDQEARATRPWTNRELVNFVHEAATKPFAALDADATRERHRGPLPRRAEIIQIVLDIFRNLAPCDDNINYLAFHMRFTDLLLRLTVLTPVCAPRDATAPLAAPRPVSDALTLKDAIDVRKNVLQILSCTCPTHTLVDDSENVTRMYVDLVASFLVDPEETLSPANLIYARGESPSSMTARPPPQADTALEVLSRIALPDGNRQVIARVVPAERVHTLFVSLVHMLPVVELDFLVTFKAAWQVWAEKLVLCLYSLAFLAPPDMKRRIKADRALGFGGVMLRLVKRYAVNIHPDYRENFAALARRAVETVKVVDDAEDLFDTPAATGGAILGFGMGYGETSIQRVEKGTGMYGGRQEDVTWSLMATPGAIDEVMFSELDSLARVG